MPQLMETVPQSRIETVTDILHGFTVTDPYRWLEDDNSAETMEWVKEENKVTFDYLSKIPYRDHVKERLASYKAPRRVRIVSTIGRAPNGKVDYKRHRAESMDELGAAAG